MAGLTVAVVGGGCSGVLATLALLRRSDVTVVLVEPGEAGGGVAYGAAREWHLLNSRAGAMSADPDDPGHFARWAGVAPEEFVPRQRFGSYLRDVLAAAVVAHPGRFRQVRARAADLRPGPSVLLDDGGELHVDHVVLAVGNPIGGAPAGLPDAILEHGSYVPDPWQPGAVESLPAGRPVLLIGTGLTAVDVALTLTADAGRSVVAVSRRGLLPLTHTAVAAPVFKPALDDCASLREVIRVVREAAGEAGDWRAVVDGLRPDLDRLWGALTPAERDAFLRHLARPWECHRHRMAPQVADRVAALRRDGRLRIRDGGIRSAAVGRDGGLVVELVSGELAVGGIVNCAGPGRLPGAADPLTAGLLARGTVRVGPHGLGLDIDPTGRLIGADGRTHRGLWVLGPLRRGARWETTAVPEIRDQARRLADDVAAERTLEAAA